ISAPNTNHQIPQQRTRQDPITPPPGTLLQGSLEAQIPSSSQILGRRRRDPSPTSEAQPDIHESTRGSVDEHQAENEHRPKRRRQGSRMRAEGESSSSNGTSRPFSNGSGPSPLHKAAVSNSANGLRKSPIAMNGSSNTNGHSTGSGKPRPSYFGHDREEVTRILIQALTDLGYDGSALNLSQESGYDLENPSVAAFRTAVLQGGWAEAEDLLFGRSTEEGGVSINGNGLALQDNMDKNAMRFGLRQQKISRVIGTARNWESFSGSAFRVDALVPGRCQTPPAFKSEYTNLNSLLMCQSTEDLKTKAGWDGAQGESRHTLLSELSKCISPSVMLPERRLAVLLDQVKRNQISNCLYHNTAASPSLYQDHECDATNFPMQPVLELTKHASQVWLVKFSNDGSRLASCGGDGSVIIYDVGSFEVQRVLSDHEDGVASFAWSPDDSMMVTCSQDRKARLWDVNTGTIKAVIPRFGEPSTSCAWAPDGQTFVVGCLANERNLCQYDLNGEEVYDWGRNHRIQDIAITPNGRWLVAMDHDTHIYGYNFITREPVFEMKMKSRLRSVCVSQDSRSLLVNMKDGEAQILDLERQTEGPIQIFKAGNQGGEDVIRATYGGANESFVATGSADGKVYIWHRENGQLIKELDGHPGGCCSAVSWNPTNPRMFASCGDDEKVRMYVTPCPHTNSRNFTNKLPRWSNEGTALQTPKVPQPEPNGW
ncbi:putative WD repeat-containing protein, partial [Lachnellula subtilissima]